jgi:hypothetical protein
MQSVIMGFIVHIVSKLEAGLEDSRRKALSCFTVEDYLTKQSVKDVATSFNETVDAHKTELYAGAHSILRIALLKRS